MARLVKSLNQGSGKLEKGYHHRNHRSKKGSKKPPTHLAQIKLYKEKLRRIKEKEMIEEIKQWK